MSHPASSPLSLSPTPVIRLLTPLCAMDACVCIVSAEMAERMLFEQQRNGCSVCGGAILQEIPLHTSVAVQATLVIALCEARATSRMVMSLTRSAGWLCLQ